jgi:nitrite reductase/ring-hydroxylating ferredoxin subunit
MLLGIADRVRLSEPGLGVSRILPAAYRASAMGATIRIEKATLPTEGKPVRVTVNGVPIAVFRVGTTLHAIDPRCTHVGGPLDQGGVAGVQVTCPLHGSVFDLTNGKVVRGPASRPVTAYRVSVDGEALVLEKLESTT